MSKKLDFILRNTPPATISNVKEEDPKFTESPQKSILEEKQLRISIVVPQSVKRQLKQYIADHPFETEKTILLKSLKAFGFKIEDKFLHDLRLKNKN